MAHASSREKGILAMKKVRAAKAKKKLEYNQKLESMTEDEKKEFHKNKSTKTLKDKIQRSIWDYKHKQYPFSKTDYLVELLKERLDEIKTNQELNCENEIREINEVLKNVY